MLFCFKSTGMSTLYADPDTIFFCIVQSFAMQFGFVYYFILIQG